MQNAAGPVFLADCPARQAVEIVSDKWAAVVIHALSRGPRRHGEIVEAIGGVSRKVLTETLRRLQRSGLVERVEEPPRRIEYRLTDLGLTLLGPIEALNDWARTYGEAVTEAEEAEEAQEAQEAQEAAAS
ncbi:winged helix-turn-helix transcriptional regulator [Leifsonia sp. SIMBA_070]|uniref:winged helix-turn-helix transcriptional regulator n=1 Tax=Leifsonia sp. SIMBA_070 TaxID=3085810 RepID=UPI00397CAAD8